MADSKRFFIHHDAHVIAAPKAYTRAIMLRAISALFIILVSAKIMHHVWIAGRTGTTNETHFGDRRLHHASPGRAPQIVNYQLNLSQAWRNPGETQWNLTPLSSAKIH